MPRSFSSFALSIWSKGVKGLTSGNLSCSTLVIAAVRVVLPWSMWPMVPMLTCGLVRSNLAFATGVLLWTGFLTPFDVGLVGVGELWSLLASGLGDDLRRHVARNLRIGVELHGVGGAPLR